MKFFSRASLKSVSFNFVGFYGETLPVAVISMLITKIKTSTAKWVFQLHNVFIILPTSITMRGLVLSYKQGNYSLRRPPKLIIPKIFIDQRWATIHRFMCHQKTVKKRHHLATRFGTCMYDPYTSTQPS